MITDIKKQKNNKTKPALTAEELMRQFQKTNYCKIDDVREPLIARLSDGKLTAAEIADEVGIAITTFYKYKCMLMIETGVNFMAKDEASYFNRQLKKAGEKEII